MINSRPTQFFFHLLPFLIILWTTNDYIFYCLCSLAMVTLTTGVFPYYFFNDQFRLLCHKHSFVCDLFFPCVTVIFYCRTNCLNRNFPFVSVSHINWHSSITLFQITDFTSDLFSGTCRTVVSLFKVLFLPSYQHIHSPWVLNVQEPTWNWVVYLAWCVWNELVRLCKGYLVNWTFGTSGF